MGFGLYACSKGNDAPQPPYNPPLSTLLINTPYVDGEFVSSVKVAQSIQLEAVDVNGKVLSVDWSVANADIASNTRTAYAQISPDGTLTGLAVGKIVVTATYSIDQAPVTGTKSLTVLA